LEVDGKWRKRERGMWRSGEVQCHVGQCRVYHWGVALRDKTPPTPFSHTHVRTHARTHTHTHRVIGLNLQMAPGPTGAPWAGEGWEVWHLLPTHYTTLPSLTDCLFPTTHTPCDLSGKRTYSWSQKFTYT
jgi:hypothetical protein